MVTLVLMGGPVRGFYASGHSGYAQRGGDIVCAGVSALTWAAYLSLKARGVPLRTYGGRRAAMCVLACPRDDQAAACDSIFEMLRLGVMAIADSYPGFVRVIPHDGGGERK